MFTYFKAHFPIAMYYKLLKENQTFYEWLRAYILFCHIVMPHSSQIWERRKQGLDVIGMKQFHSEINHQGNVSRDK